MGFNPRTRTGCDQTARRGRGAITRFNPRTRTGCDSTSQVRYLAMGLGNVYANPRILHLKFFTADDLGVLTH